MPIRQLILVFTSSLLLAACDTKPIDTEANNNEDSSGKRKRIELPKQTKEQPFKIAKTDTDLASTSVSVAEASEENNGVTLAGVELPDEVMIHIFSYLRFPAIFQASEVCKYWHRLSEEPILWKIVRLHIHGDYPANKATKENAKKHMLRMQVNILTDCKKIEWLVRKYGLNNEHPFTRYRNILGSLLYESSQEMLEEYVSQSHEMAIWLKVNGLANGSRGYKKDLAAAVDLNESWIKQGSKAAIQRKIESLAGCADYGYEKDLAAAVALNEQLARQGNEAAIQRKIEGFAYGEYGYSQDPPIAMQLNEQLIEQGNQAAIERRIEGFAEGEYGYVKDPIAAVQLNEQLVEQGNEAAIQRKIVGIAYGNYGYTKDPKAAMELNECWVSQGNQKAIQRKIDGLAQGEYGYVKDPITAVQFNEQLIEQGNQIAIERKLRGLISNASRVGSYSYGYIYGLQQLQLWLTEEEKKGTRWACYLKAQALKYGILGYQQDTHAAIQYIVEHGIPY